MPKCIFAQRCWTFSFGKCTPKCILASNAFVTFCVTKCTHQMHFCIKCIFASNAFLDQQNVRIKCICNILLVQKYILASNAFLHQQNVRIFVFCKAKNTAFLQGKLGFWCWTKEQNVQHQIHFCSSNVTNPFLLQLIFDLCFYLLHLYFIKMFKNKDFAKTKAKIQNIFSNYMLYICFFFLLLVFACYIFIL